MTDLSPVEGQYVCVPGSIINSDQSPPILRQGVSDQAVGHLNYFLGGNSVVPLHALGNGHLLARILPIPAPIR